MSQPDARRARWRADLHEYGAAVLNDAGLTNMADEHATRASALRDYAALVEELAGAKASGDAVAIRDAKRAVVDFRRIERETGAATPAAVNNFAEPSDDDLIALGY